MGNKMVVGCSKVAQASPKLRAGLRDIRCFARINHVKYIFGMGVN